MGSADELGYQPRRILVAGVSGVGKSTLCRRIAPLGYEYTEIDSLFHGPGWVPLDTFEDEVDALTALPRWVTEWQYRLVRERLLARADTLIWMDLPRRVSLGRVIRRTAVRSWTHAELWNGNTEPGMWNALTTRDGIIRWSIRTHRTYAESVPRAEAEHHHLTVVRLRSTRQVEAWLAGPFARALGVSAS